MKRSAFGIVALLAVAGAAQADLVANGGFETGDFTSWSQFGNTGFTGVVNGPFGENPHSGSFHAVFGPVGSTGGITQGLTVAANTPVNISFWLANLDSGVVNSFDVSYGGTSLTGWVNASNFGYTQYVFTNVVSNVANPALTFTFQHDPSYYLLDDVSVTVVPLPTGAALGLAGLGLVGVTGRVMRRRNA